MAQSHTQKKIVEQPPYIYRQINKDSGFLVILPFFFCTLKTMFHHKANVQVDRMQPFCKQLQSDLGSLQPFLESLLKVCKRSCCLIYRCRQHVAISLNDCQLVVFCLFFYRTGRLQRTILTVKSEFVSM